MRIRHGSAHAPRLVQDPWGTPTAGETRRLLSWRDPVVPERPTICVLVIDRWKAVLQARRADHEAAASFDEADLSPDMASPPTHLPGLAAVEDVAQPRLPYNQSPHAFSPSMPLTRALARRVGDRDHILGRPYSLGHRAITAPSTLQSATGGSTRSRSRCRG